jgi:hypothetical protein
VALLSRIRGLLGTFLGGYIADRLATRDVRWYVWLPGVAFLALPFSVFFYLWPDYRVGLAVASVATLLGAYYLGPRSRSRRRWRRSGCAPGAASCCSSPI